MTQFYGQHNSHADYMAILHGRIPNYGGHAYRENTPCFINPEVDKKKTYAEIQHHLDVARRLNRVKNK